LASAKLSKFTSFARSLAKLGPKTESNVATAFFSAAREPNLKRKRGLTIVLVEQNLGFIRQLPDRVLVIQKGQIGSELRPDQLADAALVSAFLGMREESQPA
jgi:ABC-type branched-subunit amino acid transport system ATPase component